MMQSLPSELISQISCFLNVAELWKGRRLCRRLKALFEKETEFKILSGQERLTIHLYLLNSRGLLVSSFGPESIEDKSALDLVVESVDSTTRMITFKTPIPSNPPLLLKRRRQLDRMEWSVKMQILNRDFEWSKQFVTIIAQDTPCSTNLNTCSIATFDMSMICTSQEEKKETNECKVLKFVVTSLQCSFSYFFSRLDNDRHSSNYGGWSVHSPQRRDLLLQRAEDLGLQWEEKYWVFDLTLHWLTVGELGEVDGVIQYLLEYEKVHSRSSTSLRPFPTKKRFYRSA